MADAVLDFLTQLGETLVVAFRNEDVLWGKNLKDNQIPILHVDNPLGYEHFIGNMSFLYKTE
jgi:hypothetical protein